MYLQRSVAAEAFSQDLFDSSYVPVSSYIFSSQTGFKGAFDPDIS